MKKQYILVIDLDKCVGCKGCSVSCHDGHDIAPGVNFCWLDQKGVHGVYPDLHMSYFPRSCMHCTKPPCADVCQANATFVNEEGIVLIDEDLCTGCQECIAACPYQARFFHQEKQVVQKCDRCIHLLQIGETPNCVISCQGTARIFGNAVDSNSEVSKLLKENRDIAFRDKEELGVEPNVYYLPVRKQGAYTP